MHNDHGINKDVINLSLGAIQACCTSIRYHNDVVTADELDKLDKIYYQLLEILDTVVSRSKS